jgi:hypothetical protein
MLWISNYRTDRYSGDRVTLLSMKFSELQILLCILTIKNLGAYD